LKRGGSSGNGGQSNSLARTLIGDWRVKRPHMIVTPMTPTILASLQSYSCHHPAARLPIDLPFLQGGRYDSGRGSAQLPLPRCNSAAGGTAVVNRLGYFALADLQARVARLRQLTMGLVKEGSLMEKGNNPLLSNERQAYLSAIRQAVASLESARIVMVEAIERIGRNKSSSTRRLTCW
jgi:hypothetical protein